jgi:hypothetical protein
VTAAGLPRSAWAAARAAHLEGSLLRAAIVSRIRGSRIRSLFWIESPLST